MSLNITVNSQYKLTSDSLNVIVNRKHTVDPTKSPRWPELAAKGADPSVRTEWREVSYHTGIDHAIKWIMNQRIRESDAENLTELLDEITQFGREIKAILPS